MTGFGDLRATAEAARNARDRLEELWPHRKPWPPSPIQADAADTRDITRRRFSAAVTPEVVLALLDTITAAEELPYWAEHFEPDPDGDAYEAAAAFYAAWTRLRAVLVGRLPERQETS